MNLPFDDLAERLLVDGGEEAGNIQVQRPRRAPPVRGHPTQEDHQPVAGGQGPLLAPAGVGVVNETRLEDALEVPHQQVVNDAAAKVGRKHLTRFASVGDEADRRAGPVSVVTQLPLQVEQLRLGIDFESERIDGVPLVAPTGVIVAPQLMERVEVGRHRQPRTRRSPRVFALKSRLLLVEKHGREPALPPLPGLITSRRAPHARSCCWSCCSRSRYRR